MRSRPASFACASASARERMPIFSPSAAMTRSSCARMSVLIRRLGFKVNKIIIAHQWIGKENPPSRTEYAAEYTTNSPEVKGSSFICSVTEHPQVFSRVYSAKKKQPHAQHQY